MKDFLKFTLATVVGIILSSIVLFFIGAMTVIGMIASSETETQVADNSIMFLDLKGTLEERAEDNPFKKILGDEFNNYGLDDILNSIQKAKENEKIKGIYLQANQLGGYYASLEEIRNALADFKESGKFIVAYADNYTQSLYYLSSVADKIIMNPQGSLEWKGLAAQTIFFKDLFQKLGIEMQIFKVGAYKSAVETFNATQMSPANREQITAYLGSVWNQILSDVSKSRKIPVDSLNAYADKMLAFYPAEETLKSGLVDTLLYKDGVLNYLKKLTDIKEDDNLNTLTLSDMMNVKKNVPKDKSGNILAVYYAYGDIDNSTAEGINSSKVIKDLRKLREDENVKAVVLRVNSPGGSAFGSELIWHEVVLLKEKKPVIVSMGDYAASGGYYISCAADYIVADPTTLTGSIGIFGIIPNVKGLTDKLGINFDVVKTNTFADMGTLGRGLNSDEKALMQMYIENGYNLFISRCAQGRKMSKEAIEKIAQGRVWTGIEAKGIGLVDELGGLDRALEVATEKAKLENYTVMNYPEKEDFFTALLNKKSGGYIHDQLKNEFGEYYTGFNFIKKLTEADALQARLPFEIALK